MQISQILGVGPTAQDPLYGLLDLDENFFYMVDHRENIINGLWQVLVRSKKVKIIAIHQCIDWYYKKIDNQICWSFGINLCDQTYRDHAIKYNGTEMSLIQHLTPTSEKTVAVVKNLCYVRDIITVIERQKKKFDLKYPAHMILAFNDDSWVHEDLVKESTYFLQASEQWHTLCRQVYEIMKNYCIDADDYRHHVNSGIQKLDIETMPPFLPLSKLYE
jgi:hypothetical protein